MSGRRWQDVPEEARAPIVRAIQRVSDTRHERLKFGAEYLRATGIDTATSESFARERAEYEAAEAALARLAEPTTAAERWRAVPREGRRRTLRHLAAERASRVRWIKMNRRHQSGVSLMREEIGAIDALLALAREAEGGGR
mgnify:FL=1